MNLANALTLLRILLVPVFLIAVIYGWLLHALVVFLLAGLTDLLDGFIARRLRQETALGMYLDPVSDKLLMAVSFVSLAIAGILPAWLAVLAVAKDLFVSLGVAILYFTGSRMAVAPTLWGKQTTFLQILTVALALFAAVLDRPFAGLGLLYGVTGLVTVISGMHYIFSGIRSLPPETKGRD